MSTPVICAVILSGNVFAFSENTWDVVFGISKMELDIISVHVVDL